MRDWSTEKCICPYQKEEFSTCSVGGEKKDSTLFVRAKKSTVGKLLNIGKLNFELNYNESSGYLEGRCISDTTKSILLFKDNGLKSIGRKEILSHHWVKGLIKDRSMGISAPLRRKEELLNFKFETVYFDYDQYSIRAEYTSYLNKVIKMLNSHSDIRLKIIGHTDSDGSNAYNEILSKNRVKSLISFFIQNGIEESRIVIDYKGERNPISTNDSSEGKQLNRRVSFEFI